MPDVHTRAVNGHTSIHVYDLQRKAGVDTLSTSTDILAFLLSFDPVWSVNRLRGKSTAADIGLDRVIPVEAEQALGILVGMIVLVVDVHPLFQVLVIARDDNCRRC